MLFLVPQKATDRSNYVVRASAGTVLLIQFCERIFCTRFPDLKDFYVKTGFVCWLSFSSYLLMHRAISLSKSSDRTCVSSYEFSYRRVFLVFGHKFVPVLSPYPLTLTG